MAAFLIVNRNLHDPVSWSKQCELFWQHCCSMVKSDHVLSCKNFATALSTVVYNRCSIVWYYSSIAQQIHIPNIRFTYSLTNQELELLAQARKKARHTLIRNYSIVCSLINSMHNFSNHIPIAETSSIFPLKVYPATHLDRILFYWCEIWEGSKMVMRSIHATRLILPGSIFCSALCLSSETPDLG